MTHADCIRAALSATEPRGSGEIVAATGINAKNVCQFFTYSSRKGETIRHGDRPHKYTLNPDYAPSKKVCDRSKLDRPTVTKKALQHLVASGKLLRAAIRSNVEGFESNEELMDALAMQESAEELARAVVE